MRSSFRQRTLDFVPMIMALFTPVISGQTAQITGLVRDASGTSVPAARVLLRNLATNIDVPTVTNDQGYYTIANLNPGLTTYQYRRQDFGLLRGRAFNSTSRRWPEWTLIWRLAKCVRP